jgi:hypothetical protein
MRHGYELLEPNESAWKNLHSSPAEFYAEQRDNKHRGGAEALLELDPLDLDHKGTAQAIEDMHLKLRSEASNGAQLGAKRNGLLRKAAEQMVQVDRYAAKAANGNAILTIKDWFANPAITALFPAFVESRVQAGLLQSSLVPELVFDDVAASSIKVTDTYDSTPAESRSLRQIAQGSDLPVSEISAADSTLNLTKFGRMLQWSYEVEAANQTLNFVEFQMRRMGAQIGIDETDSLLHIAIAGDGTTAGSAETNSTDTDVATSGTILFSDLLGWYYNVTNSAYRIDKAVAGKTDIKLIADLPELSDVEYLQNQAALRIPTPAAVNYYWWDGGVTGSSYVDRLVIGVDSRQAFAAYTYGGFIQEADQIISRQVKQATFSYYRGFRKFDAGAVSVLDAATVL